MASKLQEVSTYGDEDILKSITANLLTFGNVVGPVFERAQQAALDLSARLGQDLQSSTIQLGKALNDPIKGITALQRVGVAFSSAQKEQIKGFVAANQVMKAQGIILDELGKEFGGQAEAIANTTQGKLKQAANAFGDAMEKIGGVIAPTLLPAAQAVKTLSEEFQNLDPHVQTFIVSTAGLAAGLASATLAAGVAAAVFGTLSVPLLAVGATVATVGGAIYAWGDNIARVAGGIASSFSGIYQAAKTWLYDALKPIIDAVGGWVDWLGEKFAWLREKLGLDEVAGAVGRNVGAIVDGLKPYEDKLLELWRGTEGWKASLESIAVPRPKAPQGDDPDKAKDAQRELNKAIQDGVNLVKKAEGPWEAYNRQISNLQAAFKAGKITAEQFALAQKKSYEEAQIQFAGGAELIEKYQTPYEKMQETLRKLGDEYRAGAISAEALGRAQEQAALIASNAYVDMAGNIAGSLTQVFKKSKGVAIAAGVIDAIGASLKALSAYPPPFSYIAAAAAFAAGMAKVAAIRSTNEGSSSSGGGGGASGPSTAAQAPPPQQQGVLINLHGEKFGREQVLGLINGINDAVRDGAQILVNAA